jgi:hypothetical protein
MSDAIIKFPSPIKANQNRTAAEFAEKFSKVMSEQPPESCKAVTTYETVDVISVPRGLQPVPDLATAGKRNPRWGVTLSFAVMPELNEVPVGPIMLPPSPSQFFAADDLESLKERIFFEIDKGIKLAKMASEDPEAYHQYEISTMQQRLSSLRGLGEEGDN